jgi:hypothetical protein
LETKIEKETATPHREMVAPFLVQVVPIFEKLKKEK